MIDISVMMKSVFLSTTTSVATATTGTSTATACNASMTTNKNSMQMKKSLFFTTVVLSLLIYTSTITPKVHATVSKQKVVQYPSRKLTTTVSSKIEHDKQESFVSNRVSLLNIPRGGGRLLQKRPTSTTTTTISKSTTNSNNKLLHTIKIGWYFTIWYGLNVWYNIINKQLLNKVPSSIMIGTIQLGIGSLYVLLLWLLRLRSKPIFGNNDKIISYWYVGIMHSIGQLSSMVSLMSGTVSFTHIVKALEPFFSSLVSILVYKVIMPYPVYLTLIPVVCGVSYACFTDASYSTISLYAAMISNVAFAFRAVLSKVVMTNNSDNNNNQQISTTKPLLINDRSSKSIRNKSITKQEQVIIVSQNLTPVNVFGIVTILSFIVSIPIAIVWEGQHFIKVWNKAITGITPLKTFTNSKLLQQQLLISGIVHYINNEVMYMTLSNVHPITLAVGNTIKRIVIIIASVIAFGTDISTQTLIGSSIGLGGVLLYSLTKQYYEKIEGQQQQQQGQQQSSKKVVVQKKDNNSNKNKQEQNNQRQKQSSNRNSNKFDNRKGTRVTSRK